MYGLWIFVIIGGILVIYGIIAIIALNINTRDCVVLNVSGALAIIVGVIIAFAFTISAILLPLKAEKQLIAFENTREVVQQAYINGTDLDNVSITNSIIEANQWLAEAKAEKETYGIFSMYYYIDLDDIEPIVINGWDCWGNEV